MRGRLSTLADVARLTGAKPRSVQLWADAGVIKPVEGTDREGSGKHRQFRISEVAIAMVVSKFAPEQVAIGGLKGIAFTVRIRLEPGLLEAGIKGDKDLFLAMDTKLDRSGGDDFEALLMSAKIVSDESELFAFVNQRSRDGNKVTVLYLTAILAPMRELME